MKGPTDHAPALAALLIAAAAVLVPARAAAQEAPPPAAAAGASIADVRVEGNRRVEVDAIRAAISQRKGQPLDPRAIARRTSAR